ncbi:MAG: nucleoside 2-deoxyribosyltransferase [Actinobacteria bacterium]|nr:nucleoside 2-deoxyribosyltransferase [Actinomycetota bacterium]
MGTSVDPGGASVYLAGPLGFAEPGRRYHDEVLVPAVRHAGLRPLDPWEVTEAQRATLAMAGDPDGDRMKVLAEVNRALGARNAELIRRTDAILAILDGADVDSGTAAEIGYAAALGRPVVGLRTDTRVSGDNYGALVNLQVEWFVFESGGTIARTLEEAIHLLLVVTKSIR